MKPRINTRQVVKYAVSVLAYRCGLVWLFLEARRLLQRGEVRILAYHGIADSPQYLELFMAVEAFERQMRFLKRHCEVISMDDAEAIFLSRRKLARNKVVLTFDDGYRDNYVSMFPILDKYGLPATVYLATGHIDSGRPTFAYLLMLCLDETSEPTLDLRASGLKTFDIRTPALKDEAIRTIDRHARLLRAPEREALGREIATRLGFSIDDSRFRDRMLSWNDVREMSRRGVAFGAHTVTHPVLSAIPLDEADREIRSSRERIESQTGKRCASFAYPYGGPADLNDAVAELVRGASFSSAVVLHRRVNSGDQMYRLGRTMVGTAMTSSVSGRFSQSMFACEVSGLFDWLFRRETARAPRERSGLVRADPAGIRR